MATEKWLQNRDLTILSTGLNSLGGPTGAVLSSAIDNDSDLDIYADFQLDVTFGSAPTDGQLVEIYIVRTVDGTNFEDGSTASIVPRNGLVGVFIVRAVNTQQVMVIPGVLLPPRDFKVLLINRTSQAFPSSGSTLKAHTYKRQIA